MKARPAIPLDGVDAVKEFHAVASQPQVDDGRESVAEFEDLDEVFAALDALASKRAPSRAEWFASVRTPRERVGER
jgi:hypothetical protein